MTKTAFVWSALGFVVVTAGCTGTIGSVPGGQAEGNGSGAGSTGGGTNPSGTTGGTGASTGSGLTTGGATTGGAVSMPGVAATGLGRLRQLTRAQLEATLQELLGDVSALGETQQDSTREGFASVGATYNAFSVRGVEQFEDAALPLLTTVFGNVARRTALLGCTPASVDDTTCLGKFIKDFGRRAWRRPLSATEQDRYVKLAEAAGRTLGDVYQGLMHATSGLLESPNFLYRVELGGPDAKGTYWYSGWEMASRLSYFLWNSTPDATLLNAAEAGKLGTVDGVRDEASRLLASPRARTGIATFGRELVDLEMLADAPKDDARMTPALRAAMASEVEQLFGRWLETGVDAMDLFDTTATFANKELATLYGAPGAAALGTSLVPVTLPAAGLRSGLLGTGAILSIYSGQKLTSPTARGVFVREKVLCQPMPAPPNNVNTTLPTDPNLTSRQKLEMHRAPGCRECHQLFDPIGFGFEVFDWVGGLRDELGGQPIDPSGNLDDFQFKNVRELNTHLKEMPEVRACLLQNVFRYASGHLEGEGDQARLVAWQELFAKTNRQMSAFLTDMVAGDAYRTVSPVAP